MKSAQKYKAISFQLFVYFLAVLLLLLTSINVKNLLAPKKVLGVETEGINSVKFWGDFTAKNPNYIPAWIELGRTDKATEIDPNYLTP